MVELSVPVDVSAGTPIYEQIYTYLKKEIRNGNIPFSAKLPSTRVLSARMNVSRSTVQMAYDQLLSEGYVEAVPYKGYYVLKLDGLYSIETVAETEEKETAFGTKADCIDFSMSGVELDSFPYNTWRKVSKTVLLEKESELFAVGDPRGDFAFRKTISEYLHESRSVNCSPKNIILGAGTEYLLMLLDQILCRKNGKPPVYSIENPSYKKVYQILRGLGREIKPVELDENGMRTELLIESEADVAYVTPSHQFPLGIIMSIGRRMEILSWAKENNDRYIIEDDYDSEFRYKGKPIPSLQGIDSKGKVIYIGTFSKSIAPGIRMGYMCLPEELLDTYMAVAGHYSNTVSRIDQNVVNRFILDGHYERHLNKMRAIYKSRHDCLLGALKEFGKEFEVSGDSAGLHVLVSHSHMSEQEMIERAGKCGVKVYSLSEYYLDEKMPEKATVILGYARLNEDKIREGTRKLLAAWKK